MTIRAKVRSGRLEPLEKINLPEGKEVAITILRTVPTLDRSAFRRAAGKWKGTVNAAALIRHIYADRLIATRLRPRL